MAELVREIEEEDIPKLRELLTLVFGDGDYIGIERLGGMMNHSYKITRADGQEYLCRIPGEGTEDLVNRSDERKSTELACKLGIDSELLYFGDDGRKVMRFIKDPQPNSLEIMRKPENVNTLLQDDPIELSMDQLLEVAGGAKNTKSIITQTVQCPNTNECSNTCIRDCC